MLWCLILAILFDKVIVHLFRLGYSLKRKCSPLFCNQEAKEQLSPLSAALEKLQQEKQELVEQKRQRQEEGQEKVDIFTLLSLL